MDSSGAAGHPHGSESLAVASKHATKRSAFCTTTAVLRIGCRRAYVERCACPKDFFS